MKWSATNPFRLAIPLLLGLSPGMGALAQSVGSEFFGSDMAASAIISQADSLAPDTLPPLRPADEGARCIVVHDTVVRYVLMPIPVASKSIPAPANDRYATLRSKRIQRWNNLIPERASLQYAGSIGLLSFGPGWQYGRGEHWETDMLFGFLPRYHSDKAKFTFTLKERYIPWHCRLSSTWVCQPLTVGFFFNTISSNDFWRSQPDKYPANYYWCSTRIRSNIFIGQRFRYDIPQAYRRLHSSVSAYYELSTCDIYILSKVSNRHYPWHRLFSLAFGLSWEM